MLPHSRASREIMALPIALLPGWHAAVRADVSRNWQRGFTRRILSQSETELRKTERDRPGGGEGHGLFADNPNLFHF